MVHSLEVLATIRRRRYVYFLPNENQHKDRKLAVSYLRTFVELSTSGSSPFHTGRDGASHPQLT